MYQPRKLISKYFTAQLPVRGQQMLAQETGPAGEAANRQTRIGSGRQEGRSLVSTEQPIFFLLFSKA
jgi:hypothetical protein